MLADWTPEIRAVLIVALLAQATSILFMFLVARVIRLLGRVLERSISAEDRSVAAENAAAEAKAKAEEACEWAAQLEHDKMDQL